MPHGLNLARKEQASVSTARLIKTLGIDGYRKLMEDIAIKAPRIYNQRIIDDTKLSFDEINLLKKCVKLGTWKTIAAEFKFKDSQQAQTHFARLAYRYIKNLSSKS